MIDRKALLDDLSNFLKTLEADLLARSDSDKVPEVREALKAEFERAKSAERTAMNYEDWRSDFITQIAVAWVLTCVFVRFIEDNDLIDSPRLSGPGERDRFARDQHQIFVTENPTESDREYLLAVFAELRDLKGGVVGDVFGQHNLVWQLPNWISGDAASELLKFFRTVNPDSGQIVHDFTDPEWDTRFLGDLYQDLSAATRKKYALLQTPDFVEGFILDRTLEPALNEFGLTPPPPPDSNLKTPGFRMIDPACGSGHFLLGTFPRILLRWREKEPSSSVRDLVQRTLDSIHGVDINPFAIAIARFRLLLAAIKACGIKRLVDAPAFKMNLACGDSLYHGRQHQMTLKGVETNESHYFKSEDADDLRRILKEGTFHAVVANPPYITPKDKAAREAYRLLYASCHRQYSLSIPFAERIFRLAARGENGCIAGYTGQITANSFMKREFGRKLIEEYYCSVDLTHIVDTAGAYIPGHGTPTVIVFGRNRQPVSKSVRTVMGIIGEPGTPSEPSRGKVWTAILKQIDLVGSQSLYISVHDSSRETFQKHPWSLAGGGVAELTLRLSEQSEAELKDFYVSHGRVAHTGDDEAYIVPKQALLRRRVPRHQISHYVDGEVVRDWAVRESDSILFPYDTQLEVIPEIPRSPLFDWLWFFRTELWARREPNGSHREIGKTWYEYSRFHPERYAGPGITMAYVATHNHFVLDSGRKIFTPGSPVIKLDARSAETKHHDLLSVLNSSVVGFLMRQLGHNMGDSTDDAGARTTGDPAFNTFQYNTTQIASLPLPSNYARRYSQVITQIAIETRDSGPKACLATHAGSRELKKTLASSYSNQTQLLGRVAALQEELDWECYRLYGLIDDSLTYEMEQPLSIDLGERAFEIVLARKMAAEEVTTTWFERHGSTPITEIPEHWPEDYQQLVQRRLEVIESNPQIALIEQPEYKRRWNTEPWDSQVERALRSWLLDRLESYFDFDGRMDDEGTPTAKFSIEIVSLARLADVAAKDEVFMEVGKVYCDDPAFAVLPLVEELVKTEHVPLLPVLRYKDSGLRKRTEWENTWRLQREEDAMTVEVEAAEQIWRERLAQLKEARDTYKELVEAKALASEIEAAKEQVQYLEEQAEQAKADFDRLAKERDEFAVTIPLPPRYATKDFVSTGGVAYWKLRGKLDLPKERWVSFPHCPGDDGTLALCWAGCDHLQQARAISAHYVNIRDNIGGTEDPRLVPLLACLMELLPWLHQWHSEIDIEFDRRMDEYYEAFVTTGANALGLSREEVAKWKPPETTSGRRGRRST